MRRIMSLSVVMKPTGFDGQTSARSDAIGPFLQGFLLEHVDPSYVELVHRLPFNPYSQYCMVDKEGKVTWRVNALTQDAADNIIEPLRAIENVHLRATGSSYDVVSTSLETIDIKQLLDSIYEEGPSRVRVSFLSPTAFKSQGRYAIMPTVRLMFQNLLMHYSQAYEGDKEIDQDTVDFIDQNVLISSYNLQSHYFPNVASQARKIPAFVGGLTLSLSGPPSMMGLARMLLRFGQYSGIGIKTSMGMGGFACKWDS